MALHNFLINDDGYGANELVDTETRLGDWRQETRRYQGLVDLSRSGTNNYTRDAKESRDNFMEYFNSEQGSVLWQSQYAHNNT